MTKAKSNCIKANLFTILLVLLVIGELLVPNVVEPLIVNGTLFTIYAVAIFIPTAMVFQIICRAILDRQMMKQLSDIEFEYYYEQRKMDDFSSNMQKACMSDEEKKILQDIDMTIETYVKNHPVIRYYYRTFLKTNYTNTTKQTT